MKNPKYFLETNKIYFSTSDDINFERYKSWINNRSTIEFLETGHYPRSESELKITLNKSIKVITLSFSQYLKKIQKNMLEMLRLDRLIGLTEELSLEG